MQDRYVIMQYNHADFKEKYSQDGMLEITKNYY
jgi:hypothetical protein